MTKKEMAKVITTALFNLDRLVTPENKEAWNHMTSLCSRKKAELETHYDKAMVVIGERMIEKNKESKMNKETTKKIEGLTRMDVHEANSFLRNLILSRYDLDLGQVTVRTGQGKNRREIKNLDELNDLRPKDVDISIEVKNPGRNIMFAAFTSSMTVSASLSEREGKMAISGLTIWFEFKEGGSNGWSTRNSFYTQKDQPFPWTEVKR